MISTNIDSICRLSQIRDDRNKRGEATPTTSTPATSTPATSTPATHLTRENGPAKIGVTTCGLDVCRFCDLAPWTDSKHAEVDMHTMWRNTKQLENYRGADHTNAFLKLSVFLSKNTKENIFDHASALFSLVFSPVPLIRLLMQTYTSWCLFRLSATLKRP